MPTKAVSIARNQRVSLKNNIANTEETKQKKQNNIFVLYMAAKKDDFTDFFCKLSKIGNLPKCFMFYIVDIFVGVWFLIWGALANIFPLFKTIGKYSWKYIGLTIKKMWYTTWVLDTCYRCPKPKKIKTRLCGKSCPSGYKKTNIACGVIGSCKEK